MAVELDRKAVGKNPHGRAYMTVKIDPVPIITRQDICTTRVHCYQLVLDHTIWDNTVRKYLNRKLDDTQCFDMRSSHGLLTADDETDVDNVIMEALENTMNKLQDDLIDEGFEEEDAGEDEKEGHRILAHSSLRGDDRLQ